MSTCIIRLPFVLIKLLTNAFLIANRKSFLVFGILVALHMPRFAFVL